MTKSRYNCINDGRGFLATANEETRFCKQKCMKEHYGREWKPGMFVKRHRSLTLQEKLDFVDSMKF